MNIVNTKPVEKLATCPEVLSQYQSLQALYPLTFGMIAVEVEKNDWSAVLDIARVGQSMIGKNMPQAHYDAIEDLMAIQSLAFNKVFGGIRS